MLFAMLAGGGDEIQLKHSAGRDRCSLAVGIKYTWEKKDLHEEKWDFILASINTHTLMNEYIR